MELYYRRAESVHRGRAVAARVETVCVFLPDVWTCVPTRLEWDQLHSQYRRQKDRRLSGLPQLPDDSAPEANDEKALTIVMLLR